MSWRASHHITEIIRSSEMKEIKHGFEPEYIIIIITHVAEPGIWGTTGEYLPPQKSKPPWAFFEPLSVATGVFFYLILSCISSYKQVHVVCSKSYDLNNTSVTTGVAAAENKVAAQNKVRRLNTGG